jgi:hypothetical protein
MDAAIGHEEPPGEHRRPSKPNARDNQLNVHRIQAGKL